MDAPAERSTRTAGPHPHPAARALRRRPTGEPPPLPHHLQTSGVRWLVVTLVLIVATIGVFAGGLKGFAVDVAVFDAAVVGWLGGVDLPGFEPVMRGLAAISSWWVLNGVSYGLIVALLVLRRFRHLIIWLLLVNLLANIGLTILGPVTQRPRPFGAEIHEGWGGWAMPALHVTFFAVGLVTILYTLVPEGRWRNTGKWVVTALVTLTALGRMALGADGPTDVIVGAALGVTIPLLAFRWFAPNEVFPISYRRGSGAHLDVGGARGQAIRRGLEDQLGLEVTEVKPFGLSGSAGSTPLRITVAGDPPAQLFGKLYALSHLRSDRWYKLGRELLYGRLEDEKPFNTVRRLVQQEDYALSLMHRAGLPSPTPFGFVELTPEREYLLVTEFFAGATELGEAEVDTPGDRRRPRHHPQAVGRRAGPPRHQAGQPAGPPGPDAADRRGLRPGPAQPLAPGRGPGQHDALPGPALQPRAGLPAGPASSSRSRRSPRASPPPGAWPCRRSSATCCGPRAATSMPSSSACCRRHPSRCRSSGGACGGWGCWRPRRSWPGCWSSWWSTRPPTRRRSGRPSGSKASPAPTWSRCGCRPRLCRRRRWCPACARCRWGGRWATWPSTTAGRRSPSTTTGPAAQAMVARLTAGCATGQAAEEPSGQEGVRRYQLVERQAPWFTVVRFDVFPGGCLTTRIRTPTVHRAEVTGSAAGILGFTSRGQLGLALEQRSGGRLHLDPVPEG